MTREQLNALPAALTEQELEQVTGGAASNNHFDPFFEVKVTGSFDTFTGTGSNGGAISGDQGALNINQHIPSK